MRGGVGDNGAHTKRNRTARPNRTKNTALCRSLWRSRRATSRLWRLHDGWLSGSLLVLHSAARLLYVCACMCAVEPEERGGARAVCVCVCAGYLLRHGPNMSACTNEKREQVIFFSKPKTLSSTSTSDVTTICRRWFANGLSSSCVNCNAKQLSVALALAFRSLHPSRWHTVN